ncbi:MAG: hypothetical protein COB84_07075 [Rhodobacteraceae bacterium]|nr:MAG: hypothetical protein COB84_07075 [Paracoccaceae bacterium]
MHNGTLLEGIWNGHITSTQSRFSKDIKHLLKSILPFYTVCLSANTATISSRILPEEIELLPALPLGDILAEELSENVPHGSMIVILKEQNCKAVMNKPDVSYQLGLIIGDMLLGIIGEGVFPLKYETEALRVMANSYCYLIENLERQQHEICSSSFHNGLSYAVSAYWNGSTQNDLNTCKAKEKYASKIMLFGGHLKMLNSYIWTRNSKQKHINLSEIHGKLCNRQTWKKNIVGAVLEEILSDASQVYNH